MLRSLGKIILLLMIVIMASGSPLYFDRIDADTFWERASDNGDVSLPVDENGPVEVAADYRFQQAEAGHYDLYVDLQILHGEIPYEKDLLVLEILIDQEPLRTLDFTSVSPEHSPGDPLTGETVEFHFPINQEILELSDGEFELRLRTDQEDISIVEEESFQIIFQRDFHYFASLLRNPQGGIPLVLYFPTEMTDYSVPVTRFITTTDRRLVQAAIALANGPDEGLGLKSGDEYDFPSWGHISLQQGRTSVNIHGDFERFDDPQLWPPIFRAFIYSFLSTPGVRASEHQFYFNHEVRDESFGGIQVDDPVGFPDGPRLYFGYTTETNRGLLVPAFLGDEDSFESIMGLFSEEGELLNPEGYYQLHQLRGNPHFYDHLKFPIIPSDFYPSDLYIEDNIVHFSFDESALEAFSEEQILMMIDGLLKGYLQFLNIDGIVISLDGENEKDSLFHYPLDTPISEPVFINIENS